MKTSSVISLVCSLAINGFNTFHQPAVAGQVPKPLHVAEALSPADTKIEHKWRSIVDRRAVEIEPSLDAAGSGTQGLALIFEEFAKE